MFRTILLPIDFSEPSARAARFAAAIALHTGSTVRAITVKTSPDVAVDRSHLVEEFVYDATDTIQKIANLPTTQEIQFEFETHVNEVISRAILKAAVAEDIDLVVMGTHGRSGLTAMLLGSVTEQVKSELRKPLLVVGRRDDPMVAEARLPQKILIAIDFTETSLAALRQAIKLAEIWRSRLLLLHSVEPSLAVAYTTINPGAMIAVDSEFIAQAQTSLEELAKNEIPAHVAYETIITEGDPTLQILQSIEEHNIDLLIVGPRRHSKIERMIIGSTTNRLLQKCPVPVWVHQQSLYPPAR